MALRIRKDGRILCAAHHPAEEGDLYLDDFIHAYLGWCSDQHAETRQLDNYDWEKHEYFIEGRKETEPSELYSPVEKLMMEGKRRGKI